MKRSFAADGDTENVRAAEAELASCRAPMVASLAERYRQATELTAVHGTHPRRGREAGRRVGLPPEVTCATGREQLKTMLLRLPRGRYN